ncbi:hypothetical protein L4D76_24185 [Photobacterium sagamiensis]|uniref:hypothetical protein n=1 Tax=Photobacterium sagamiensis TaxID=2910241 RepID=UPI003D11E082
MDSKRSYPTGHASDEVIQLDDEHDSSDTTIEIKSNIDPTIMYGFDEFWEELGKRM